VRKAALDDAIFIIFAPELCTDEVALQLPPPCFDEFASPVRWSSREAYLCHAIGGIEAVPQCLFRGEPTASIPVLRGENGLIGGVYLGNVSGGVKELADIEDLLHELHRIALIQGDACRVRPKGRELIAEEVLDRRDIEFSVAFDKGGL
jgi:hypothetical protein